MMPSRASRHDESWLLLPWLANGRLSHGERLEVEGHLSECEACREELARQRLMCQLLTEPERVTHAPGPSFRKLMDRIDGHSSGEPRAPALSQAPRPARAGRGASAAIAWWRAPPLAWAASLVLAVGLATVATTTYYWSQDRYTTRSDPGRPSPGVLHVAFVRSLPIGEMEQMLRSASARVVEGPDASGIFGIAPAEASPDMRALAARMRADPRVRWVEPLAGTTGGS
ncbi:MAG TPA: zf-HC2 domain-containing protein [Steroidobacteraceae bacterium]|jgi:anti-sigma factor RsiW|nr:zf-HC2 domain-containing protein [Steroidobacteraceae bacterium]